MDIVTGTIESCYNAGPIENYYTGTKNCSAGGICGQNTNGYIYKCYNYGTVTTSTNGCCGSIAGCCYGLINNSYWLNESPNVLYGYTTGQKNVSCSSKTSNELKQLASTLGAFYKADTNNINNGYPILTWQ